MRVLVLVNLVLVLFELFKVQLFHRGPTGVRQNANEPSVDLLWASHGMLILAFA